MPSPAIEEGSTTEGLPVAPSLAPTLERSRVEGRTALIDLETVLMCAASAFVGVIAGLAARALVVLIRLITSLSFYGKWSLKPVDARANHLGLWVILVPAAGAVVIGLIKRFGSREVAGHGIPEAMERVLSHESRIPARMTFLKPLSAAVSIGTGGPFGPEGPIIATGGALGSLVGQLLPTTGPQRKVLLAAGASAGIAAAFNCPLAAVLLAVELLLFEFRPRSIIPVIFAAGAAVMVRMSFEGIGPVFPIPGARPPMPGAAAMGMYILLGAAIGVGAVVLTRTVFAIEAGVAHLPGHWIYPLIGGALVVGVIGYWDPAIFGAGYFNLDWLLSGQTALKAAAILCVLKFIAWTISLGSGTSGGTLAPVFTIGGSLAVVLALAAQRWISVAGFDLRVAALVGMVAIFAGASRALLTSVIFAVEVTHEPLAVLPVMCGCAVAYIVSALLMRESIMTGKMAERGVRVPAEYAADVLGSVKALAAATTRLTVIQEHEAAEAVRRRVAEGLPGWTHQGYPVVDGNGKLVGVVTRRDLNRAGVSVGSAVRELVRRKPIVAEGEESLRDVVERMVREDVGRVVVVEGGKPVGIVTRSDVLRVMGMGG